MNEMPGAVAELAQPGTDDTPLQRRDRFESALHELLRTAGAERDDSRVITALDAALAALMAVVGAKDASLLVRDESTEELVFVITRGEVAPDRLQWRRLARGYGIASWVADRQTPVIVNDTTWDARFCSWLDEELKFKTRNVLAAPVIWQGQTLGVAELLNKDANRLFTHGDQTRLELLCHFAGMVLTRMLSGSGARGAADSLADTAARLLDAARR